MSTRTARFTRSAAASLAGGRLPQFDLVSVRVDDPPKLAVLRVIDLIEDVAAFGFERRDQSVEVFNAVVDHERGCAWGELLRFLRSDQPRGRAACRLAIRAGPVEGGAAPCLDVDAEMLLVPGLQRGCILRLEKDSADASDTLHANLRSFSRWGLRQCSCTRDLASPEWVILRRTGKKSRSAGV